jgi:hypothetical protein
MWASYYIDIVRPQVSCEGKCFQPWEADQTPLRKEIRLFRNATKNHGLEKRDISLPTMRLSASQKSLCSLKLVSGVGKSVSVYLPSRFL